MDSGPKPAGSPALVIAGMHRSGTSLLASLLADAGVWIGDELVPATPTNPKGHFEDVEFFRLHQRMLAASGLGQEGYTCQPAVAVPAAARAAAAALVDRRRQSGRVWGWKDPRTTLFLDFWAEIVPEARFVFIVRPPWEVVDSLFRRGDDAFALNPRLAVDLWAAYNRRIRDFVRAHRDRCAVVETARVAADPTGFVESVAALLGVPLTRPAPQFEPELLVTHHAHHRSSLVHATRPEALDLLAELRCLAGADAAAVPADVASGDVVEAALAEWSAAAAATRTVASRDRHVAEHAQALATVTAEFDAERFAGQRLAERCVTLSRAFNDMATALEAERAAVNALQGDHAREIADLEARLEAERAANALQSECAGATAEHAACPPADRDRDVILAQQEAARLAAQLQAEREIFEAHRQDLVARLDAALDGAAGIRPPSPGESRRRSIGARIVAEGRRFVRRVGERSRRAA
jgi:hypothetical protein